ncbi:MAG: ribose 5-phosphate isomerase B [Bacteroidales bacterium]|nr:ribose 5-phosphate isomerase B [Bacteroidales bacterium]
MAVKKIAFASDHAGYQLKRKIIAFLEKSGYECKDFGSHSDEAVDYPDFAHPLSFAIENGEFELGITFCGSGNGINMAANKHKGIRSAVCWNPEISKLARLHNNANVCAIPARFIDEETAREVVKQFLTTSFEGGRHQGRIDKINCTC